MPGMAPGWAVATVLPGRVGADATGRDPMKHPMKRPHEATP